MKLRNYYHANFRDDLAALLHGINLPEARIVTLGYDWVDHCALLTRVSVEHRPSFLVCLHFTILADQVMDYHFSFLYPEFERLTMYPKFRLGLGHPAYLNPIRILEDPIRCNLVTASEIRNLIPDSMRLFVAETVDFFKRQITEITVADFFNRVLADPDIAAEWIADRAVNPDNLSLKKFVAVELGKVVSEIPKG
jgi:hypothetical protein